LLYQQAFKCRPRQAITSTHSPSTMASASSMEAHFHQLRVHRPLRVNQAPDATGSHMESYTRRATGRYHPWIGSDERGHRRSNAAMRELVLTMMGFVTLTLAGAGPGRAFRGCLAVAPVGWLSEGLRMDAWYGLKSKCTGLVPDRFGATLGRPAQSLYITTLELLGLRSSCPGIFCIIR